MKILYPPLSYTCTCMSLNDHMLFGCTYEIFDNTLHVCSNYLAKFNYFVLCISVLHKTCMLFSCEYCQICILKMKPSSVTWCSLAMEAGFIGSRNTHPMKKSHSTVKFHVVILYRLILVYIIICKHISCTLTVALLSCMATIHAVYWMYHWMNNWTG